MPNHLDGVKMGTESHNSKVRNMSTQMDGNNSKIWAPTPEDVNTDGWPGWHNYVNEYPHAMHMFLHGVAHGHAVALTVGVAVPVVMASAVLVDIRGATVTRFAVAVAAISRRCERARSYN